VKSVLGEFSFGVSICRNKGTQSDLGAPFYPPSPRLGVLNALARGSRTSPVRITRYSRWTTGTKFCDLHTNENGIHVRSQWNREKNRMRLASWPSLYYWINNSLTNSHETTALSYLSGVQ